ncbi:hypothetical protein [Sulfurovum riftiae]|uniref:DUF5667 domain-containing protein n=1 Tax=Sulfurovum riftiae TaxID=1630136 RepID=A0A151CI32_9BACT|nr:hypothetical protein [Sulfurovum riftiae]KYJ87195.1 hypothetical protein AS592_11895 [Sulfurovum riftiae]
MSKFFKITVTVSFFLFGTCSLFALESKTEEYKLKSGMVIYSIRGGGILAPDLNLTIIGEGKLRFREWGKVALVEEEIEESTAGAFRNIEKFTKCIKYDKRQQFNVDYDQEIIRERPIPKGRGLKDLTVGMMPHGNDVIAGRECEVWRREGVRICLYKGIPLLIEKELFGIHYEKRALWVEENIDVATEQCTIPDFPVQKIALFKTSIKQKKAPAEVSKHISDILDEISGKNSLNLKKHKQFYLNRLGEHIFERQKALLAEMFGSMKRARECLQGADDSLEANDCIEEINAFKAKMVKEDENNIDTWDTASKNRILDEFDENIAVLESRMKCIRAAKNITDLSSCMSR